MTSEAMAAEAHSTGHQPDDIDRPEWKGFLFMGISGASD